MTQFDQVRIQQQLKSAAEALRAAQALLITAGAGMGVDSGLPDFRGVEGFWRAYPAAKKLGLRFEQLANPSWFERDPALAWGFYGHRLNLYRDTTPHAGFATLKQWGERIGHAFVFTSNVDGQFQAAGFSDEQIVECHGSIHYLQCVRSACRAIESGALHSVCVDLDSLRAVEPLPRCDRCGSSLRPNILMFGDYGWQSDRAEAQTRRYEAWLNSIDRRTLVVIEFGAGTSIPTVRYESERRAGKLIRVNPREWDVPSGHFALPLNAASAIAELDALLANP